MTPGVMEVWLPSALLLLQVPGCVPLHGPSKVTGTVGESLSVQCQYKEEHKTNDKYWCRVSLLPCKEIVRTRASKEAGKGRVSIRDHPATLTFTVTLEKLTLEDAGTYKCGVDMPHIDDSLGIYPFLGIDDDSLKVVVSVVPGGSTAQDPITGPDTVSGQQQGSLTVQCRYDSSWKKHKKYWCQGADWSTCEILLKTNASEQLVKKDRVSIRDDQTGFIVTVTMEDLRISDAGIYWCGIERSGRDLHFEVNVNIDPAPETSTKIVSIMAPVLTTTASTMENTGNYGGTQTNTHTWSLLSSIYFKLLVFLEVPLLLGMLSAVLWVNRPQRCSGGK